MHRHYQIPITMYFYLLPYAGKFGQLLGGSHGTVALDLPMDPMLFTTLEQDNMQFYWQKIDKCFFFISGGISLSIIEIFNVQIK